MSLKIMITFTERKDFDPAHLVQLYMQAPWAIGRTAEDTREMLTYTDLAISAWDGNRLVGFGRVLTDYVYRATIWDVIVDKE
ncbi:MAG: GNAT family N-acetyltransferase, partial [Nitrospiraceae bacterium]